MDSLYNFVFFDEVVSFLSFLSLLSVEGGLVLFKTFVSDIKNIPLETAFGTQVPYGFVKTYDTIAQ